MVGPRRVVVVVPMGMVGVGPIEVVVVGPMEMVGVVPIVVVVVPKLLESMRVRALLALGSDEYSPPYAIANARSCE